MKYLILALVLTLLPIESKSDTLAQANAIEYGLNQASPNQMQKNQLGTVVTRELLQSVRLVYDRSIQSGANGAVVLLDPVTLKPATLPDGAVIRDCLIDVITTPTGSGTIALGTGQSTTDLKTATAIASYTGRVACVPVGSAATAIKLTADRSPVATIASGPIATGKFNVFIDYVLSK